MQEGSFCKIIGGLDIILGNVAVWPYRDLPVHVQKHDKNHAQTLRLNIAQTTYMLWFSGSTTLEHESIEP